MEHVVLSPWPKTVRSISAKSILASSVRGTKLIYRVQWVGVRAEGGSGVCSVVSLV
jgi:hypothetical protein